MCVSQYELVADLFQDVAQAVTSPTRRAGAAGYVPVRPAKELPKSSSQQKQSRKTVGSQASTSVCCSCWWLTSLSVNPLKGTVVNWLHLAIQV